MNNKLLPATLGELRASGYRPRSVKEEMRENLVAGLKSGKTLFPGMVGYEATVLRQLTTALLSRHDIILLGHRGQGKTRLLRELVSLLDERIPLISGSPVNDDPFAPISRHGKDLLRLEGDKTPISWLEREQRYGEKLATPDVTIADLIGDVDPIRALNEKLDYGHEGILHFGIIPRSNRGIFVINELPDLQARIQVGLLNILEERDFQIRGFPVRLPLDIFLAFSANPEDYTNRGNIITPLKDRIDSQILTHYPKDVDTATRITDQEAWVERNPPVLVHPVLREVLEQIAFEARADKDYIDQSSGVSARLSITALENLVSAVERRRYRDNVGDCRFARFMDLESVLPSITGKIELVYEGEREGPLQVARMLITKATKTVFLRHFRDPYNPNEKDPEKNPYFAVIHWFEKGNTLVLKDDVDDATHFDMLRSHPFLEKAVRECTVDPNRVEGDKEALPIYMELMLEGLQSNSRLSKTNVTEGFLYKDMMADIFTGA